MTLTEVVINALKDVCLGQWTEKSHFRRLSIATFFHRKSLHLSKTYCQTLTDEAIVDFPDSLATFMTGHRKYIFLYIGLSNDISGNVTKFEVNFNRKLTKEMKSRFLYVVWLRESRPTNYAIRYQYNVITRVVGQPESIRSTDSMKGKDLNSKQVLFDDDWLDTNILNTTLVTEVVPRISKIPDHSPETRINESYIIFCARLTNDSQPEVYSIKNCYPREAYLQENKIYCECGPGDREFVGIVVAIFWLIFAVLLIIPLLIEAINTNIEHDLFIFSACNHKNALFQYKITLRLGRVTKRFNMKKSFIDIQFFNSDKESLGKVVIVDLILVSQSIVTPLTTGPEVRIPANLLKSRNVNDVVIQMYRLTKIPDIDKIYCGHNSTRVSGVYIYGLSVETLKHYGSEEPIDTQYIVQRYIFSEKRFINTLKKENLKEEEMSSETNLSPALITTAELTYYQVVWLMFIIYTIFGFTSFLIQFNLNAYDFVNYCLAIIGTFTIAGSVGYFLLFALRYLNRCDQIQVILMNSTNKYWCMKLLYYFVTAIVALSMQRTLFTQGPNIDLIETFYWLSATFFCCAIFTSLCIISYELQKLLAPEEEESLREEMSASFSNSIGQSDKRH